MPPTGPFVRISLQQQLRSYKVGSYNAVQSRVMIGSNGICSFLGWDAGAAMLLCSRRAIRKECQWNIITPSPFIGFYWMEVLVIPILNPSNSKGKGDLDWAMLMKSGQVRSPHILVAKVEQLFSPDKSETISQFQYEPIKDYLFYIFSCSNDCL